MSIKIKYWKGRLGNNIRQIKNSLIYGLFYNMNISIPSHNFFISRIITINKNNEDNKTYYDIGNKKKNQFFQIKDIVLNLKPSFENITYIIHMKSVGKEEGENGNFENRINNVSNFSRKNILKYLD